MRPKLTEQLEVGVGVGVGVGIKEVVEVEVGYSFPCQHLYDLIPCDLSTLRVQY
jgi:hypothetical protein